MCEITLIWKKICEAFSEGSETFFPCACGAKGNGDNVLEKYTSSPHVFLAVLSSPPSVI